MYNPLNVEITLSDVQNILNKYDVSPYVDNIELYKRAFVHKSYMINNDASATVEQQQQQQQNYIPLKSKSNERLEYVGDGILEAITKFYLYTRFPTEDEGFMTDIKIAVVKNEAIGKIAYEMGLHKWLLLSKHAEDKKIRTNFAKLGCLFEAFLGAMFLDFNKVIVEDDEHIFVSEQLIGLGFQMATKFMINVFEKHVNWTDIISNDDNYKNILQLTTQKEFKTTPLYVLKEQSQEFGYKMGVYLKLGTSEELFQININDFNSFDSIRECLNTYNGLYMFMGEGIHKIKKKAEQMACNEAINVINRWT